MTRSEKQRKQLQELHKNLWSVCCDFWGKMAPDDYKDYLLGLLFYRYLSENVERRVKSLLEEDGISYEDAWADEEYREALKEDLIDSVGYVIEPDYLFSKFYSMINIEKKGFDIEQLQKGINALMESTLGQESQEAFYGIFEDMDLNSTKLGRAVADRSKLIAKAITTINNIDFQYEDSEIDVLGDAYEYLIAQFATHSGKKSGSFYTPQAVGDLMARITTLGRPDVLNAFDACGGSGSLLLTLRKYSDVRNLYYQELTTSTYNLARMNMLLHGVSYQNFHMENNDSLQYPSFMDVPMDIVVANPPYSQKWDADSSFESDDRFSKYGALAPKSKADYAFLTSMLHTLKDDGIMAIVLPHGILFRGAAEAKIRKSLIENGNIDTVIGLPANVFFGTSIPTTILILKKNRANKDVLFIDASKDFEAAKNRNYLREQDVEKIVEAYTNRQDIEKYAHLASFEEIEENDFNLNIPRYVDSFEEEEEINIDEAERSLTDITSDISEIDKKLADFYAQLGI